MKLLIVFGVVAIWAVVADAQGIPIRNCPDGEHSVLYCPRRAEPSCEKPYIHNLDGIEGGLCDIPDCWCNVPNVRDTKNGKCIPLTQCKN